MKGIRNIHLRVDESTFKKLKKIKESQSWEEFLVKAGLKEEEE